MEKHASKPASSAGIRMGDGDWICSDVDCGNINFSRRTSCNRCGKERAELKLKKKMGTEIGKSAADKSRGLFSADDWQCNKCANVNWARRQTCNVCNAPKFGEVEARTGYGGGYNERGTVEYRPKRDSDDDEFDEFGRRKKKKNKDQPDKVMSIQRVQRYSVGSQGDISTYQLSASKKSASIPVDDQRIPKAMEHNSDNRSIENLRESRYSRSSENSSDLLKRLTSNSASASKQGRIRRENDYPTEHYSGRVNEWISRKSSLSSPRDCIMENRVSSTNELKYRFSGKTIDENFEVVYTLEERVSAAAWAIAYMNCKMSAEQFQNTFDKPAPDFKTVFAWRQRLLSTGCLVDSHTSPETPDVMDTKETNKFRRKLGRRKRARYYEQRGETTESSSDERASKSFKKNIPSSRSSKSDKVGLEMSCLNDKQNGGRQERNSIDNNEETNSESKDNQRDSSNKPSNEYDNTYLTDPARSITPEFTNARIDLANIGKSPQNKFHTEVQFTEDIYFDDDAPKAKSNESVSNEESQFLVPKVPKGKNRTGTPKNVEESLKSVLEDIVSESERYTSDDNSDSEFRCKTYEVNNDGKSQPTTYIASNNVRYQPSCTVSKSHTLELPVPKFAEHKSAENNIETLKLCSPSLEGCSRNMSSAMRRIYESMNNRSKGSDGDSGLEYVPTKINPAMAMRNHQLFNSEIIVEAAHDLFSDNSTPLGDEQHSLIPAISLSSGIDPDKKSDKKANVFKIQMFEDYIPDDDALYKDGSSEELSDENEEPEEVIPSDNDNVTKKAAILENSRKVDKALEKTVAKICDNDMSLESNKEAIDAADKQPEVMATNDSISQKPIDSYSHLETSKSTSADTNQTIGKDSTSNLDVNPLASLLNINFSNINAEALAKALKDIQTIAVLVQKNVPPAPQVEKPVSSEECVIVNNDDPNKNTTIIVDDDPEETQPKEANIPFLSDMFDPGTPPNDTEKTSTGAVLEKITDLSNVQETNLDDLLDLPPRPIGGFKSFAIPKPIMLNRLKVMNTSNSNKDTSHKSNGKRRKKRSKNNDGASKEAEDGEEDNEDEESGDDGDLSKYDLWGSDEEKDNGKEETPATNSANAESSDKKATEKPVSSSPQNNDDLRSRTSKKSSGSTSRSSSSSSSSSDSSSGPVPRNRYDDFNLNSEMSRAESADSSRSRSNSRDRKHINKSRSDKKHKRSSPDYRRDRQDRHSKSHHGDRDKHRKESDRRHYNSHRHRR